MLNAVDMNPQSFNCKKWKASSGSFKRFSGAYNKESISSNDYEITSHEPCVHYYKKDQQHAGPDRSPIKTAD